MSKSKKKNLMIVGALCMVLAIGSALAYFTATDSMTNVFTVGKVAVDLTEPAWDDGNGGGDKNIDEDGDGIKDSEQLTPNKVLNKNPQLTNTGDNIAYGFIRVTVPKATIKTANLDGTQNEASLVELFQLNSVVRDNSAHSTDTNTNAVVQWQNRKPSNGGPGNNGLDSYNSADWFLVASADGSSSTTDITKTGIVSGASETSAWNYVDLSKNNVYVFAYAKRNDSNPATKAKLTALNPNKDTHVGDTTTPLFESVTFCNAIESNDVATLEATSPQINIEGFAIQASDLNQNNSDDAATVWSYLCNQNPVGE